MSMNRGSIVLLAFLVTMGSSNSQTAQAPEPAGDPTQSESNATKKTIKPEKTGPPPQISAAGAADPAAPSTKSGTFAATSPSSSKPSGTPNKGEPSAKPSASPKAAPAANALTVWVNTATGVYHKPGTHWYGKTKQGKYMTEPDAVKAGYRAAGKN